MRHLNDSVRFVLVMGAILLVLLALMAMQSARGRAVQLPPNRYSSPR